MLATTAPALGQLVDSGTPDSSLRCAPVAVRDVATGDVLNLRRGPGTQYEIVGRLKPDAIARATGLTTQVGSFVWYQVGNEDCEAKGWANSRFLEVQTVGDSPATTTQSAQPSAAAEEDRIQFSPFTTGLLFLGFTVLLAGSAMAIWGRRSPQGDSGPPPGMVGPPGGPYYLARVNQPPTEPRIIQIGGARRSTDRDDPPVSAFPEIPDLVLDSVAETEAESLAGPNAPDRENRS